jgi:hypothetical protein
MYRRDTYGIHLILIKREQTKRKEKETIHEKKTNFFDGHRKKKKQHQIKILNMEFKYLENG